MLQKTGRDSRLLSLAGLVCFKGTLDTGSTATRSALAVMLGIGRRLRSNVDKARATRWPIDVLKVWSAPWSDAESAFQRDAARKRLVLQEMRPDEINWAAPSAHVPDEHAGVAVQATVAFPVLNDDSSAGVVLRRWYPDTRSDRKPDENLACADHCPGTAAVRVRQQQEPMAVDRSLAARWCRRASDVAAPVQQRTSALVVIDGLLMLASDNVAAMAPMAGGLRVEGVVTIEASHLLFGEI